MAALAAHILHCSSASFSNPSTQRLLLLPRHGLRPKLRRTHKIQSMNSDMLGDFGARDPFPEEIASNFGENVLGNTDTEHKMLIPTASALSLSLLHCSPVPSSQPPMSLPDAQALLLKVVGWRLVEEEDGLKLECVWKLRDMQCGVELVDRITKVAEAAGHPATLHLEEPNQVRAKLWTPSIGGLSMNDFILAAKIDEVKTSDLVPRRRVWA